MVMFSYLEPLSFSYLCSSFGSRYFRVCSFLCPVCVLSSVLSVWYVLVSMSVCPLSLCLCLSLSVCGTSCFIWQSLVSRVFSFASFASLVWICVSCARTCDLFPRLPLWVFRLYTFLCPMSQSPSWYANFWLCLTQHQFSSRFCNVTFSSQIKLWFWV